MIPQLRGWYERYEKDGFTVVGVHSPEFEREKVRDSVIAKAAQFGLHHPIMLDNDLSYWRALDNEYWPAWYLVDGAGVVRTVVVGHARTPQRFQIAISLSCTTGYWTPSFFVASTTLS